MQSRQIAVKGAITEARARCQFLRRVQMPDSKSKKKVGWFRGRNSRLMRCHVSQQTSSVPLDRFGMNGVRNVRD